MSQETATPNNHRNRLKTQENIMNSKTGTGLIAGIFATALSLALPNATLAQDVIGDLGVMVSVPQGEFREKLDDPGFGLNANIALRLPGSPVYAGIEGSVMTYGTETRREPFSPTIPDVTVEVENNYNIALGNVFVRLQPDMDVVTPYVDGFVGLNYLFTSTSVQNIGRLDENVATSTNVDDAAFSYGGGVGMMVRLFHDDYPMVDEEGNSGVHDGYIDFRVRYSHGDKARYLTSGSIIREGGSVRYNITESRTDMLTALLGFTVRF
jgi:hypothetical protein